ncbi:LytR/AlgR family response regulator transcription factor [Psychroserpens sp. BH13MA-6]
MKTPRIYIVEDEPLIVSTIETALRKNGYEIAGDADDYGSAIKDIEAIHPDLILLDIQLNGQQDGVDLAEILDDKQIPYVYLTSQTDPQTVNRMKLTNPLGYIVKPFTEHSLRSQLDLAWHHHISKNPEFITLKSDGRMYRVNLNDILYLKAFDNYCYVHTTTRTHLVPHTLKHMLEELKGDQFVKTHRSYVVNINQVDAVQNNKLFLKTEPIPLSATQKSLVLSKLKRQ